MANKRALSFMFCFFLRALSTYITKGRCSFVVDYLTFARPTLIISFVIILRSVMLYFLQVLSAKIWDKIKFVKLGSCTKSKYVIATLMNFSVDL